MFGSKGSVRHWWAGPVTGIARVAATWATITWAWEKVRSQIFAAGRDTRKEAERVARDARRIIASGDAKSVQMLRSEVLKKAPASVQRIVDLSREESMEKKKSWSLFKVILVLGMVIAVAVFLLDRILPKPYRDEELEDSWMPEDDDVTSSAPTPPMAADGVAEPEDDDDVKADAGSNGKVEEPKKKTTTRRRSTKKDDDA